MTKKKNKTKKKANELSSGVSQEDFLKVLENISKRLCHKFRFAYHDIEDMKQQAAIFALEGLEKYDRKRPLENFLWTHVRNRLFNYKRNNYQRPDKPCLTCPFFDKTFKNSMNQCTKYIDKQECEPYKAWSKRNDSKKNIIQPSYIEEDLHPVKSKDLSNLIQDKEIIMFLDINVETEYREFYLKLKHGSKIPKQQLDKLKKHIMDLMEKKLWKIPNLHVNEDN